MPSSSPVDVREVTAAARTVQAAIDWSTSAEPDVVLLLARSNAQLSLAGMREVDGELAMQLDRLIELRLEGARGGWGWGLQSSWDAFSDGVTNPASTIYAYTTAAAALALIDGHRALGEVRLIDAAERAAVALLTDTCCWRRGRYLSVWYDDQVNDQIPERQVHNVNGLSLAALSGLDSIRGAPRFLHERTAMAAHLIDDQGRGFTQDKYGDTPVSDANWRYSMAETPRPNDLIHETFIVEGLLAHGTIPAVEAAERSASGIARCHFTSDGAPRPGLYTRGSLGWGPAAGLFALAQFPALRADADRIASHLVSTVDDRGSSLAAFNEPRAQAWYALALARYARVAGTTGADVGSPGS